MLTLKLSAGRGCRARSHNCSWIDGAALRVAAVSPGIERRVPIKQKMACGAHEHRIWGAGARPVAASFTPLVVYLHTYHQSALVGNNISRRHFLYTYWDIRFLNRNSSGPLELT